MNKYRNIGFKLTPQRLAILSYLEGNKEHPSATIRLLLSARKATSWSFLLIPTRDDMIPIHQCIIT
jgi:Fur family peroxide stress response transcriptional regulator